MPSFNPQLWQNFDLKNENQSRDFLRQLSNWCTQMQQPQTIAGLLNGGAMLNQTALAVSRSDFGTITTDQTINVNSSASVVVAFTSTTTQTRTLTINNLAYGTPVFITAGVSSGTLTLKITATLPGGGAYSVFSLLTSTLAQTSMGTGLAIVAAVNSQFFAISQSEAGSPILFFYNV